MAHRSLTKNLKPHERIILAYDKSTFDEKDWELLEKLIPYTGIIKVGMQAMGRRVLGTSTVAMQVIDAVENQNGSIMYDGKYKDIGNTIKEGIKSLVSWNHPPKIATIHATMRLESIMAALEVARDSGMLVAGVTLLTDHTDDDSLNIYCDKSEDVVLRCALRLEKASQKTGVPAGIVCAPKELKILNRFELIKITPGIRDNYAPVDDQNRDRTMTATAAMAEGADYEVIGRPIMQAEDPVVAAKEIAMQIQSGL